MHNVVQNLKISVSGVRGVVGETFTTQLVTSMAMTFGTYLGRGRIIVGRDTRPTGEMVEHAVTAGLLAVGCQPYLAGIIPTPTLQIMVNEYKTIGGIAITASHNPLPWNALKFVNSAGIFLNDIEARDLLDLYHQQSRAFVPEPELRSVKYLDNSFAIHQQRIFSLINVDAIRACRFKVAMDCCNGVGAYSAVCFLQDLGCEVIPLFDKAEGRFEREPEPVPAHLTALGKVVRDHQCQLGFAQDPDGDRLAIVNSQGIPIGENNTLVLAIKHYLTREKGPVVVSMVTSSAAEYVTQQAGCEIHYTKIGEINVTSKMLQLGAVIGGESNGGVIWPKVHPCRDSYSAMALILEMMAVRKKSIEELLTEFPEYYSSTKKVEASNEQAQHIIQTMQKEYATYRLNLLDGVKINWDDRWVIIRPSNTEPIMRIMAEAKSQAAADELTQEFADKCRQLI